MHRRLDAGGHQAAAVVQARGFVGDHAGVGGDVAGQALGRGLDDVRRLERRQAPVAVAGQFGDSLVGELAVKPLLAGFQGGAGVVAQVVADAVFQAAHGLADAFAAQLHHAADAGQLGEHVFFQQEVLDAGVEHLADHVADQRMVETGVDGFFAQGFQAQGLLQDGFEVRLVQQLPHRGRVVAGLFQNRFAHLNDHRPQPLGGVHAGQPVVHHLGQGVRVHQGAHRGFAQRFNAVVQLLLPVALLLQAQAGVFHMGVFERVGQLGCVHGVPLFIRSVPLI